MNSIQSLRSFLSRSGNLRNNLSLLRSLATKDPPPDLSRGGTADLCDVYHPEQVDVMHDPPLKIAHPIFKSASPPLQ